MSFTPYLSIVVAVRNDNHGGDFIKRFQNCLNSLFYLNSIYPLPIEIVIVEWNTPDYKPSIAQYTDLSIKPSSCNVEFISVPPSVHNRYKYNERLPMYQMIAKNVGIRRANGEFILCTNADIIFSEELFRFLAEKNLQKWTIYRTLRIDVDNNILNFSSYNELIDYCKNNIIRVNGYTSYKNINQTGDECYWIHTLNNLSRYNIFRGMDEQLDKEFLFTNACGDFQLMHREHWQNLRGYPEFDKYSFHLDSILEYQAFYSGIKECILPNSQSIYHIEHDSGFIPEKKIEFENKHPQGFRISDLELEYFRIGIKNNHERKILNDKNWGLSLDKAVRKNYSNNLPKITFAAVPKNFENEFENIQYNAIFSWLSLSIGAEILLICDNHFKTPSFSFPDKVRFVYGLEYTKYNKPSLKSVFEIISKNIESGYIVYVNSDIIFLDDFSKAVEEIIANLEEKTFIVGKRRNIELKEKIDFANIHWWDKIHQIYSNSIYDSELSIDYFIFNKEFLKGTIPDFSIGGMYWDNWIVYKAFLDRIILVDASDSIAAIHQNHSYTNNQTVKDILQSEMAEYNFQLMGGNINKKHLGNIDITYSDNHFISKTGDNIDIKEIISTHREDFKNFSEYSDFIKRYVSTFLGISNNVKFDLDFYLSNLDVFAYNPDVILNISIYIINTKLREYFHIFSPLLQRVVDIGYLNGDNMLGIRYKNKTSAHIDYWQNKDNSLSKLVLGIIHYYGFGCEKNEEKGLENFFQYYLETKETFSKLLFFRLFFDAKKEPYMLKFIQHFETEETPEVFYFLGMVYCRGIGNFINEDEELTKRYFVKAAENGLKEGLNYLGIKYIMDKELEIGKKYFKIGEQYGDLLSKKNIKYLMDSNDA